MSVRYTIKCEQDDPLLRPFEETMSFVKGFRQMVVPASVGSGQLTALEIDPEFHVNFQFYRLSVPLEVTKEWQGDAGHFVTIAFYDLELPQKAWTWMRGNEVVYDQQGVNIYTGATNLTINKSKPPSCRRFHASSPSATTCTRYRADSRIFL